MPEGKVIEPFAGAGNPLYYVSHDSKEMQVIKGQRYGVGGKEIKGRKVSYKTHILKLEEVDSAITPAASIPGTCGYSRVTALLPEADRASL